MHGSRTLLGQPLSQLDIIWSYRSNFALLFYKSTFHGPLFKHKCKVPQMLHTHAAFHRKSSAHTHGFKTIDLRNKGYCPPPQCLYVDSAMHTLGKRQRENRSKKQLETCLYHKVTTQLSSH